MSEKQILQAACCKENCKGLDELFKRAFCWALKRNDGIGRIARHAYSLYENGGKLHRFVADFLKFLGFRKIATT